ncbi:ribosomal L22e protein family [Actinidia rufa]|uniref:Ribosomal L22e protein family n=1 Tax=Actinidia rufa TaxID=165716 RepID=A0A7J0FKX2_9ERIC|nr:ribosomal L22e protein family [Actinidia rufa]
MTQKVDGGRGYNPINNDRKRKRVYGDHDSNNGGMFNRNIETSPRKVISRGWNEFKYDAAREKKTMRGKSCDFEQLEKQKSFKGERKSREFETETLDNYGSKKLTLKLKPIDKMEPVKIDRSGINLVKNDSKYVSDARKRAEQKNNCFAADSLGKSGKKKVYDKKSVADDFAENYEPRKKKKPDIRIDPHDISNKRLADGTVTTDDLLRSSDKSRQPLPKVLDSRSRHATIRRDSNRSCVALTRLIVSRLAPASLADIHLTLAVTVHLRFVVSSLDLVSPSCDWHCWTTLPVVYDFAAIEEEGTEQGSDVIFVLVLLARDSDKVTESTGLAAYFDALLEELFQRGDVHDLIDFSLLAKNLSSKVYHRP